MTVEPLPSVRRWGAPPVLRLAPADDPQLPALDRRIDAALAAGPLPAAVGALAHALEGWAAEGPADLLLAVEADGRTLVLRRGAGWARLIPAMGGAPSPFACEDNVRPAQAEVAVFSLRTGERLELFLRAAQPGATPDAQLAAPAEPSPARPPPPRTYLLDPLNGVDRARVDRYLRAVTVRSGTTLITEGSPGDTSYIVVSGRLRVRRGPTFLVDVGPGEHLGDLALASARPRSATVEALTDTDVLALHRADFDRILSQNPRLGTRLAVPLLQRLGDRVRALTDRVEVTEADARARFTRMHHDGARRLARASPWAAVLYAAWRAPDLGLAAAGWCALVIAVDVITLAHLRARATDGASALPAHRVLHAVFGLAWGSAALVHGPTEAIGAFDPALPWLVGTTSVATATLATDARSLAAVQLGTWAPLVLHLAAASGWAAAPLLAAIALLVAGQHFLARLSRERVAAAAEESARAARNASDLATVQAALAQANSTVAAQNAALEDALHRITRLANTDALTGLANRRQSAERLRGLAPDARAALLFLDLDHFKSINDRFGHAVGDEVLVAVAGRLREAAGASAVVGRWGGEEFVVCDPATDDARACGEALRAALRATAVPTAAGPLTVTASIGAARREPGEPLDAWIARADGACYAAKHGGRDQVRVG
jgi:diguanylate cyclase (GGDEF)-like protein